VYEDLSEIIFNSISDGVFAVNEQCIITSFNRAAEEITGFKRAEAIGKHCFEIFRTEICHKSCALKDTLKQHAPIENVRVAILTRNGCEIPISVTTTLLRNARGRAIGAVEFFRDISEVEHLEMHLKRNKTLGGIVSVNERMQKLIQLIPDIAESECSVLIRGPSGSGKELFAQAIHSLSPRKYGPYIKLNCAALPTELLESELFGYEKGAFTDAKRNKPGQFCIANGGTLLLDEIGEMDLSLQAKLLRVLQNGEYRPLGSSKTLHADARIITCTNADLQEAMKRGTFREDLYYRINVVELQIPPLRDRPEDIPLLVSHFLKLMKKKRRKTIERVSDETLNALRAYPFPGNVRELENAIEHAFVMCHGREIRPEHLPLKITSGTKDPDAIHRKSRGEREVILEALKRNMGNKSKTAKELGMHRSTLWRKLQSYGISSSGKTVPPTTGSATQRS